MSRNIMQFGEAKPKDAEELNKDGKEIAHHYNAYTAFEAIVKNLPAGKNNDSERTIS